MDVASLRVGYDKGVHDVEGNVSATGVGFWIDTVQPPLVNAPLLVRVQAVQEEPVFVPARVRHVRFDEQKKAYYVGAAFVPSDELVDASLYRYVEERMLASRTGVIA